MAARGLAELTLRLDRPPAPSLARGSLPTEAVEQRAEAIRECEAFLQRVQDFHRQYGGADDNCAGNQILDAFAPLSDGAEWAQDFIVRGEPGISLASIVDGNMPQQRQAQSGIGPQHRGHWDLDLI